MKFDRYYEPTIVDECIQLMNDYGRDARLLAGGTDLVVKLRSRAIRAKAVVSLNGIPELSKVVKAGGGLQIGAMARLIDVSKSDQLTGAWQAIKAAAGHVSSMQIRNLATLGGNSCNASPAADTVPALIVNDAEVTIAGPRGERVVPLEQFFVGPGITVLNQGEIVTSFKLPDLGRGNGAIYKKYAIRGDTDIAIIGIAARLKVVAGKVIEEARLVLGGVASTPLRLPDVENMLVGNTLTTELGAAVAEAAAEACRPISDARATKEYRKEMVRVWTRDVLRQANQQAAASFN